ncbi:polyprenyl synthetase family protein [Luteimonas vadosa]|uniref:Polyprenyl synthetase family protein n=1 Tax=Luteimonas vadosa TaxID=1165507 RepID=A0ABP9E4Y9_9GAMM
MPDSLRPRAAAAERIEAWRGRIDGVLERALTRQPAAESRLQLAMRHAVLLGGKRMRPLLVYATGTAFGAPASSLDAPAAAVELVHAYSLVHDDLPAMDDDALRRGKPTVHVAFDEATAILAGDALQSLAFAVLADADADATVRVDMLRELADAAGAWGMCGGQALDLAATSGRERGQGETSRKRSRDQDGPLRETPADPVSSPPAESPAEPLPSIGSLEQLHALKTGALLRASVRLGAIAAGVEPAMRERLDAFAGALGLAFQIRDDLLDVEGNDTSLGKTAGKDAAQGKATFATVIGADASRERLAALAAAMRNALAPLGERGETLAFLGERAIDRSH